jgi:hypothetical protein
MPIKTKTRKQKLDLTLRPLRKSLRPLRFNSVKTGEPKRKEREGNRKGRKDFLILYRIEFKIRNVSIQKLRGCKKKII